MIDREHELPVVRQVQLLDLARSTVYYRPQPMSESDLQLMRAIDKLHLEHHAVIRVQVNSAIFHLRPPVVKQVRKLTLTSPPHRGGRPAR